MDDRPFRARGPDRELLVSDYLPLAHEWWVWGNEQNPAVCLADWETQRIEAVSTLLSSR